MILRKRGETHKQFIKRLQDNNTLLQNKAADLIEDMIDQNIVPYSEHKIALNKIQQLRQLLQKYNLWQGE